MKLDLFSNESQTSPVEATARASGPHFRLVRDVFAVHCVVPFNAVVVASDEVHCSSSSAARDSETGARKMAWSFLPG